MKTSIIEVIIPDDVTPENIAELLNNSSYSCILSSDDDIFVHGNLDFPVWLTIDQNDRDITCNCYLGIKKNSDLLTLAMFIKKINDIPSQCNFNFDVSHDNGFCQIGGSSILRFDFGLHFPNLLMTIKLLSESFYSGCLEDIAGNFIIFDNDRNIINEFVHDF